MLFLYRHSNRFILICDYFAFVTAICGPTERTEVLVCLIFYYLFVILNCCFYFEFIIGDPTFLFFLGFFTIFLLDKE
jgi:hypothetical protein